VRCGEDHEVGCGPCGRAVQAEPLVVNPGNTAWRFGHCTFKTPCNDLSELSSDLPIGLCEHRVTGYIRRHWKPIACQPADLYQ
jgi:hypothetical protein